MDKCWVYVTASGAAPDALSTALLARAQQLSRENELELEAVIVGEGCKAAAESLASGGIQKVFYADISGLNPCEHERISAILEPLVLQHQPEIFLFPAGDSASQVASALGVKLGTGVNVHCVTADIRDGIFIGSVPAFGGQVMSEILCPVKRPQMATVRLSGGALQAGKAGTAVSFAESAPEVPGLELLSCSAEEKSGPSLSDASFVLCGGAGLGDHDGWLMMRKLAER